MALSAELISDDGLRAVSGPVEYDLVNGERWIDYYRVRDGGNAFDVTTFKQAEGLPQENDAHPSQVGLVARSVFRYRVESQSSVIAGVVYQEPGRGDLLDPFVRDELPADFSSFEDTSAPRQTDIVVQQGLLATVPLDSYPYARIIPRRIRAPFTFEAPSPGDDITVTAHYTDTSWLSSSTQLRGTINQNSVSMPPIEEVPGTSWTAPAGSLLFMKRSSPQRLGSGFLRVVYRFRYAADLELTYQTDPSDSSTEATETVPPHHVAFQQRDDQQQGIGRLFVGLPDGVRFETYPWQSWWRA